jgi:hypothetical protein
MIMLMADAVVTINQSAIDTYAKGKKWYWYALAWVFGAYVFVALLGFEQNKPMPFFIAIPNAFDFFLHEMAHVITGFLPAILTAAAGSFSEILLGTILLVTAIWQRAYFAVLATSLWFMLACQSAGTYMADARTQKMDLVSLGDSGGGVIHDWHFVFDQLHILNLDTFIGGSVRAMGAIVGLFGLGFSAYVIYRMATAPKDKAPK